MIATSEQDKKGLRVAGKLLAEALRDLASRTKPGVSTASLNSFAEESIRKNGASPVFLNYDEDDSPYPYPAALCISINNEVVHGMPSDERIIKEGDIVSLDLGLEKDGYIVDSAYTVIAGKGNEEQTKLLEGTKKALTAGIHAAKAGNRTGDVGAAVAAVAKEYGLSVVYDLGGHGTGKKLHELPFVANFGTAGKGEKLTEGLVLALEPIFTLGDGAIVVGKDGWTYLTRDHSSAAHFEHTIIVGKNDSEVVTVL